MTIPGAPPHHAPSPATVRAIAEPRAIIVTGMHQSGTALVARFIGGLGIDLADDGALHREILRRACPAGDPGVADWGWTESERLDGAAVEGARKIVMEYAARRRDATLGGWGFHEPRATLLLDLWAQVLPSAVFVLGYRAPWDVVSSTLGLGDPQFQARPDYAARVWLGYARALLSFASHHPGRSILVNVDAFVRAPAAFAAALERTMASALPAAGDPVVVSRAAEPIAAEALISHDPDGPLARLLRAAAPEVAGAYAELEHMADLPAGGRGSAPIDPEAVAVEAVAAWLCDERGRQHAADAAPGHQRAGPSSHQDPAHGSRRRSPVGRLRRLTSALGAAGPAAEAAAVAPVQEAPAQQPALDPAERWFREHYDEAAGHTLAFLEAGGISIEGKDVGDVGSGDGIIDLGLVHRGRPRRLVGYDLRCTDRANLAEQAARYGAGEVPPELVFEASEPRRLPAADGSFDVVVTWSAFEHISDPVAVATEIRRVLRPGGVLFLQLWPFHRSERGSHLWDWFPEPHHHLLEHEDDIVERMLASDVHDPGFTRYMADEFRRLNRVTLEELHRSLLAAGFRVARLELMTGVVQFPPALSRYSLADLAISGVKLLAL